MYAGKVNLIQIIVQVKIDNLMILKLKKKFYKISEYMKIEV